MRQFCLDNHHEDYFSDVINSVNFGDEQTDDHTEEYLKNPESKQNDFLDIYVNSSSV